MSTQIASAVSKEGFFKQKLGILGINQKLEVVSSILCGTDLDKRKRIVTNVKVNGKRFATRAKQDRNLIRTRTSKKYTEIYGDLFELSLCTREN